MILITIALALVALYCGGMWAWHFVRWAQYGFGPVAYETEANTFHLGLCFILALGFLGLLLK